MSGHKGRSVAFDERSQKTAVCSRRFLLYPDLRNGGNSKKTSTHGFLDNPHVMRKHVTCL